MKGILPDFFKNVADYIGLPYEFVICKDRNEYIWYQSHTDSIDIAIDARVSDAIIEKIIMEPVARISQWLLLVLCEKAIRVILKQSLL